MFRPDLEAQLDDMAEKDWALHVRRVWPGNPGEEWSFHELTVYGDTPGDVHMLANRICSMLNDANLDAELDVWENARYVTYWEAGDELWANCKYNHLRRQVKDVDREEWIDVLCDSFGELQDRYIERDDGTTVDIGTDADEPKVLELYS